MNKPQHIHIIGICGVATSAIAIALHKNGWKVTGSDKGFYPPVSTALENAGVKFYAGWHPEKMSADGDPDMIMVGGGGTSNNNPEALYAKTKGIPYLSYAQLLGKHFVKRNSIVSVGTWGKTTTSALLAFIMSEAGMSPSYMFGGVSDMLPAAALHDGEWSVFEGDEYQSAIWDKRPKFAYYHPSHLLFTSVSWDHADLYPTEADYFDIFERIVGSVPAKKIVACTDDDGVRKILIKLKYRPTTYGTLDGVDFRYANVEQSKDGIAFDIMYDNEPHHIQSPLLGSYNAENITGVFAMAVTLGIESEVVADSIHRFTGIKRRLEKRYVGDVTVIDAHAPTPEKAASNLKTLREIFDGPSTGSGRKSKIFAIFEPNIGGRNRESIPQYTNAFKDADNVYIPHFTKVKVDPSKEAPLEGDELTEIIARSQSNTVYIDDDDKLITDVIRKVKKGDVIVFLGSHGFRGMIEETIKKLTTTAPKSKSKK
ncbi:hypothetical protein COB55_00325 [Candidatus Wolfebacteria bacterium]|nr:MAG: hypothetical protein COB55_00325 [Candidatus Wolfebacteria bacterium]